MQRPVLVLALAVGLSACGGQALEAPASYEPAPIAVADVQSATPSGEIVVAYAEEPRRWYPDGSAEPAAVDLAHLWGLPLYRIDDEGLLRPALAEDADVLSRQDGWTVEITLRAGTWSDGEPVRAGDVVATIDALRADPTRAPQVAAITGVTAVSDQVVRLELAEPAGRWPYVLAGGWSVLPAHVLAQGGLAAYDGPPAVSGGPFTVAGHEPGRRVQFQAHAGSPAGAPNLAAIEIAFVPEFDTALGLLGAERVDVALGHLALNPVERAQEIEGVAGAAPLGGTTVSLVWRGSGSLGGTGAIDERAKVRDSVDVGPQVEGLLGRFGAVSRSWLPSRSGPWGGDAPATSLEGIVPTVVIPRWQESPAFTARSIQRDLRTFGGGMELVRLEPDELAGSSQGDGVLSVRRDGPWPSLTALVDPADSEDVRAAAAAADRAPARDHPAVVEATARMYEEGHVLPLYRIGVAHAWRATVSGLEPSSWPGLGFWNVATWASRGG